MFNSVSTTLITDDRGEIDIRILAEHQTNRQDFDSAEVYSVWNSVQEPLGLFTRMGDELFYEGDGLNESEQRQVSDFIKAYRGGDWDL
ncbi:MAG: hypothetical protein JST19_13575 [Bacteroidetes bacterium]|nr:hypothetical protein [Bacteroidota bacterium]